MRIKRESAAASAPAKAAAGLGSAPRRSIKKSLGVSSAPVDGAKLLDEFMIELRAHVVLNECQSAVVALWTLLTHAAMFSSSPRLLLESPEPGCGKTTALNVLACVVAKPLLTTDITTAALFREIDARQPTLLIDEADALLASTALISILNAGHQRNSATIIRVATGGGTRKFRTFAPAAIATIAPVPPTLASRSISIRLRRRLPTESVKPLDDAARNKLQHLSRQAARWALENKDELSSATPNMPIFIQNRAADNWRPLLAIADIAGGTWSQKARQAVQQLGATTSNIKSAGEMLLDDIRELIARKDTKQQIVAAELATALSDLEARPWRNWKGRGPLTASEVAHLLEPYGIEPRKVRVGRRTRMAYAVSQFEDAFSRYLITPRQRGETVAASLPTRFTAKIITFARGFLFFGQARSSMPKEGRVARRKPK